MHLRHYAKSFLINFLQFIVQIINQKIHLEMNIISVVPDFLFNDLEGFWQINQRIRGHHYNDTDLLQAPYKLSYQAAEIEKKTVLLVDKRPALHPEGSRYTRFFFHIQLAHSPQESISKYSDIRYR